MILLYELLVGNNQTARPLGTLTGQKLPHTEEAWNSLNQCLEIVELSIEDPTLALTEILSYLVSVRDIIV